ncbi:cyclin-t2 [Plakobranchus ocellatus]|uniref:Cyclin-t2 n=1 Tax=Plakobranchus ocellatus TaxID=259542 RepID=A0AAV3YRI2_9GAST|nr:cyclin-t2 [Plakobranchus ocellatus]
MDEMGCGFKWLFVDEELRNTPTIRIGISASQEQTFRMKQAMLIQTIGSKSRLTQLAMNTSVIFMHRFFMFRTVKQFPRLHLAVAFAFAGGKVEESFCKLEHLVRSAVDVIRSNKNREFLDKSDSLTYEMDCQWRGKMEALLQSNCNTDSSAYQDMRKIILECEAEIYAVIGFNLSIVHPHNFVVRMCGLLGAENIKDISHYAYNLATASSQLTMMCLKYKPEVIAIMCLNIASKAHNVDFMSLKDKKVKWFQAFDSTLELSDVEAVSREFLSLAKGYLFWKDANGQQVFLHRRGMPVQPRGQGSSSTSQGTRQQHVAHSAPQSNLTSFASTSQPHAALVSHTSSNQTARSSSSSYQGHSQHHQAPVPSHQHNVPSVQSSSSASAASHASYSHAGNGLRQNPADLLGGRSSAGATSTSKDQSHASRSQQRQTQQQQQQVHLQPSAQHQVQQHHGHHHHHHHHQHHHHQQQRPSVPPTTTNVGRPTTLPASQPQDTHIPRQSQPLTSSTSAMGAHPHQALHHSSSSSSLPQISSSSSRDMPSSQTQPSLETSRQAQRPSRSQSELGKHRQLTHHNAQENTRSQNMQQLRPESLRPSDSNPEDARNRMHRAASAAQLAHYKQQPTQQHMASDASYAQQQHLAPARQSQVNVAQQQEPPRQQPQQIAQQGMHLEMMQQPRSRSGNGQHYRQHTSVPAQLQQQSQQLIASTHLQQAHVQQQRPHSHAASGQPVELSPHTPPLPYPGSSVEAPALSQTVSHPPSATAVHTLPGSGDAPHVPGMGSSQQPPRNGQSSASQFRGTKNPSELNSESPFSMSSNSTSRDISRTSEQTSMLNQAVLSNDKSLDLEGFVDIKLEASTTSAADDKTLSAAVSNFTKPQDSPSNPRIKIKVKRDPSSGERHSVKYADTGLKIKIKPPKPESENEVGPSVSCHSSRSSTPKEEGELDSTPSPASSTSSGRKSEGLKLRLSLPKSEGSGTGGNKRDSDQWPNGLAGERDSSAHRSHHHNHHHSRHHKSKKHSKYSRHESKSSSKRSATGDNGDERPAKSSRPESYPSSGSVSHSLSLQTGGYPGLSSTSSTNSSSFSTNSDSAYQQGFSISDAFSLTMPNDIFDDDDDDDDTLPSIPLTPVDALPQVPHHERFHQMMTQHHARMDMKHGASGSRPPS